MCGIFGFFSKDRHLKSAELSLAIENMRHRGPNNAGAVVFQDGGSKYFSDEFPTGEYNSILAHTRLSIIDLTTIANQPMCNEDGSVWISYNGEIYNFHDVRNELLEKGHRFKSKSDTEVIIHGYEEWGRDVVHRLRGMFAFAIFDAKKNKLILARDRLGVKPLKYFFDGNTFIFASELKGIMHLIPKKLDPCSVNKFLTLKYIPSPHTIIEGVKKVSPAELIELDTNTMRLETEKYWKPGFYPKNNISFAEAKEAFKKLFSESVYLRTISDVPIGVYLSGGIDSSAMVAFLKENGINDINTFTIKFNRPGYDESEYARMVANRFQTAHHEFMTPELSYDDLHDIITSLDEPFGDPSYIPTYYLSKFTSRHVNVILSGDGGDEILGGYKRYFIHARGSILKHLPRLKMNLAKRLPPEINKKSFIGRLQRIEEALSAGYLDSYIQRFNGLNNSFKRRVMAPDFYNSISDLAIDNLLDVPDDLERIYNNIEQLIYIDMQSYLPDYILTKTDLALMSHSVEGRNPFVDYKLVEFSNALPPEYKFKNSGKYILKKILEGYIPREILYRKKMGFSPPIKYWFRENFDLLYDIFSKSDFVSGDIFYLSRIHEAIERFKTPEINISEQLWIIIVLELWRRKYKI